MDGSNFYAEVGGNIKTYRKLQHMTQQELAGKINKSMACISKYEKGDIYIDLYTLYEIAEVLNIPPALLLPQDTGASRSVSQPDIDFPPFLQHSPLYLYTWYTKRSELATSVLMIQRETRKVTAYYGVSDLSRYQDSDYIMLGSVVSSESNVQLHFANPLLKGDFMLVCFRTADLITGHCQGFFGALNDHYRFCASKCYISDTPVRDLAALEKQLTVDKDALSFLRKNNVLCL